MCGDRGIATKYQMIVTDADAARAECARLSRGQRESKDLCDRDTGNRLILGVGVGIPAACELGQSRSESQQSVSVFVIEY